MVLEILVQINNINEVIYNKKNETLRNEALGSKTLGNMEGLNSKDIKKQWIQLNQFVVKIIGKIFATNWLTVPA